MTSTAVLTMFLVLHECYVMLHQFLYLSALFHFMFNAVLYTFKGFSLWPSPSLFFTIAWNCRGFDGNAQYTKMSYIWTPKYYTFMAIHYTRVSVIEWNRRFGCTLVSRHPITIVSGCTTNTKLKSFHLKLLDFYFPLFILIRLFFFCVGNTSMPKRNVPTDLTLMDCQLSENSAVSLNVENSAIIHENRFLALIARLQAAGWDVPSFICCSPSLLPFSFPAL